MNPAIGEIINQSFLCLPSDEQHAVTSLAVQYQYADGSLTQDTFNELTRRLHEARGGWDYERSVSKIKTIGRASGLDIDGISLETDEYEEPYKDELVIEALAQTGRLIDAMVRFSKRPQNETAVVEPIMIAATLKERLMMASVANRTIVPDAINDTYFDIPSLEDWGGLYASYGLAANAQQIASVLAGEYTPLGNFDRHDEYAFVQRQRAKYIALGGEWALQAKAVQMSGEELDDPEIADRIIAERISYFDFDDTETSLYVASKLALRAVQLGLDDQAESFMSTAIDLLPRGVNSRIGVAALGYISIFSVYCGQIETAREDYLSARDLARDIVPAERIRIHETGIAHQDEGDAFLNGSMSGYGLASLMLADVIAFDQYDKLFISARTIREGHEDLGLEFATHNLSPIQQLQAFISTIRGGVHQRVRSEPELVLKRLA